MTKIKLLLTFAVTLALGLTLVSGGCSGPRDLPTPTLISPTDGATSIPLRLSFFWLSINQASYEFQLSKDASFSALIDQQSGLKDNKYIPAKLAPDTVYYWRVRAKAFGKTTSPWAAAKFTTGADVAPPKPAPIQGE